MSDKLLKGTIVSVRVKQGFEYLKVLQSDTLSLSAFTKEDQAEHVKELVNTHFIDKMPKQNEKEIALEDKMFLSSLRVSKKMIQHIV